MNLDKLFALSLNTMQEKWKTWNCFNPYTVKGGKKWPMTYFFAYNFWTVRD